MIKNLGDIFVRVFLHFTQYENRPMFVRQRLNGLADHRDPFSTKHRFVNRVAAIGHFKSVVFSTLVE